MKTWLTLKDLSNSSLVYSTAIWIFVVPAILKISGAASDLWGGSEILVPYSFYLLYFSSVSIFVASSIFLVACPYFVKKVHSYSFFIKEGMSIVNINDSLCKVDRNKSKGLIKILRKEVGAASPKEIDDGEVLTISSGVEPASFSFNKSEFDKVFWIVYDFHHQQRVFFQLLCWFFYLVGFFLIAFLFFANFSSVVSYFLIF